MIFDVAHTPDLYDQYICVFREQVCELPLGHLCARRLCVWLLPMWTVFFETKPKSTYHFPHNAKATLNCSRHPWRSWRVNNCFWYLSEHDSQGIRHNLVPLGKECISTCKLEHFSNIFILLCRLLKGVFTV